MSKVVRADVVFGLAWGDEAKGKIVQQLISDKSYNWVCRYSGGSNAGHTIYKDGKKYHTNLIPGGVLSGIKSFIGPECYVNLEDLDKEMEYLSKEGFNINLVKVSPFVHIITPEHKEEDRKKYIGSQGSTGKGIAPCARDKYARLGKRLMDIENFENLKYFNKDTNIMTEELSGNILCEGSQGMWLDINYGNYPYVTSSSILPYNACSLGFHPSVIKNIYGAAKIYDTRVGEDPLFSDELLKDETLSKIAEVGQEFGTTTGRQRKVNWLDISSLKKAINITGTNKIIISKVDILEKVGVYKLSDGTKFSTIYEMKEYIKTYIYSNCPLIETVLFSDSPIDF